MLHALLADQTPHSRKSLLTSLATNSVGFGAPASQFRRLDRRHLLLPCNRSALSANCPDLIAAEAGHTDVVLAFEDELDISLFEAGGAAKLGELAGGRDEVIDEIVSYIEEDLHDCQYDGGGRSKVEVEGGDLGAGLPLQLPESIYFPRLGRTPRERARPASSSTIPFHPRWIPIRSRAW